MKNVFITGADRGIAYAICVKFLTEGYRVFAGQYMTNWTELAALKETYGNQLELIPLDVGNTESVHQAAALVSDKTDCIDILINCAGIAAGDSRKEMVATYNINTLGPMRMVEAFLPLMEQGMKRLCFVSSEAGSITLAHRTDSFSYCMSKSSLNMAVKLMHNELSKDGYIFRLYHPGWVRSYMEGHKSTEGNYEPEETAETAYRQFTEDRAYENILLLTDVKDEIWSF